MIYLRSALFLLWGILVSVTMNVGFLPILILPRGITVYLARIWARLILWGLKWTAGLDVEVRGRLPDPRVIVAAKHFTMWETIAVMAFLPDPAIVLKRSLFRIPFYGWYGRKMQMIPIDRSAGGRSIRRMHAAATRVLKAGRPVVIFPEGTRKKPGDEPDYKPGVAGLYLQLGVPCVPVAHNSGLFWTGGFLRRPGTIVLEYLEPIPPGLKRREFMAQLEHRIEDATNRLLKEGREELRSLSPAKA
ncbi:MAG TPA: lysophospholipid acyltransferase family protein [Micropepsaceae bacterium]|nr:lysophospholipid acyltransferase family protein [Micropepsaceae bacterium]